MKVFGTRLDFGQDCFTGDIGYEVVFAGCKKALDGNPCKNCHSPHLWSFDENKKELTIDKVRRDLQTFPCDAFIILGGEPLDQNPFVLFELLIVGKQWTKYSILWSGYEEDYVKDLFSSSITWKNVFESLDYIKLGKYDPDRPPNGKLASDNQKVYRVKVDGSHLYLTPIEFL